MYDAKGHLIVENEETQVGVKKYLRVKQYDTLGRILQIKNSSNIQDDTRKLETYLYDGNGKSPIENKSYSNGKLWSEFFYVNDNHSNPVKITKKNYVNEPTVDIEYNEYTYDPQGNWITKTTTEVYQDKSFKSYPIITQRTIIYY